MIHDAPAPETAAATRRRRDGRSASPVRLRHRVLERRQPEGRGVRLDIEGEDVSDQALADYIVRDLRLLMVGIVRIRNKAILTEPHKRSRPGLVDVSHEIEDGMITYRGL
jgi:hypothetical protein